MNHSRKMNHPLIKQKPSQTPTNPDLIQIMGGVFNPEQLAQVIKQLEEDGHCCTIFDGLKGLRSALCNPRTKLLLLGAVNSEIPQLIEIFRSNSANGRDIPILFCFKESFPENEAELLISHVDDFLIGPFNVRDICLRVSCLQSRSMMVSDEVQHTKFNLISHFGFQQLVGRSPAFLATVEKLPRVAACDVSVLLIGDTGTGKEMCARAIHYLSPRSSHPFIPVNCGSIPADLFENEMFGHEAGAFTDARQARRGLIAEAEGGTLFLDEVDSLPLSAQVKLLRFLQDHEYRPLGASAYRRANTRLVVASNQDLQRKVQEGTFREDLYYRLKVISLQLPALCERQDDIVPLALHFLRTAAAEYKRPVARFSHNAMQKLIAYSWPGNVRELENVVRQAIVLTEKPVIRAHDLHLASETQESVSTLQEPFNVAKARVIENFERNYLNEVVSACDGNISHAARVAKKDRRAFFALLKKHALTTNHRHRSTELQSSL